ncbi:MAG: TolB family protein, partial [Armatimonadota bacterium]
MCSHSHWRRMIGAIRLIGVAAGVVIAQHDAGAAEAAAIAEVSCVFPRWSPDGTRITFVRDGGRWDKKQVWVIGADGTEPMRVAEDFLRATHPTWSPDGEMIAFAGSRGNEQMQIWLADARDGHVLRQLTYSPPRKMFPCFSPDGEHLIYFTWSGVGIVSQEGADDYLLIRTDWPEEPRNAALVAPRFSPDGEWIAFAPAVPWPEERVSVARADGSDIAEVENTQRACESLTWTPDGRLVVLCCGRTAEELRICAEPGAPIPKARLLRELRGAHSADWSPDGKSLVVSRGGRLYTVDVMRWDERLIGGLPDGGAPPTVNRSAEQRWLPIAKAAEAAGDYARATAVYRTMLAANDIAVLP